MIEANEPTNGQVVKQETPNKITTSMITEDLENGIDRQGIQEKYGLESWEVKQMFQHPVLKGKKAKKVKKLSFEFVDDSVEDPNQTSIPIPEPRIKPLEEQIVREALETEEDEDTDFEY